MRNFKIAVKAIDAIDQALGDKLVEPGADHNYTASMIEGIYSFQAVCHQLMVGLGWWTDIKTMQPFTQEQINVPEKLCLIHSEISEAMEGYRKNLMDDKLPDRKMIEVELADAMIRIGDLAGWLNLDLAGAITEKLAYNLRRADHKIENRKAEGGKAF